MNSQKISTRRRLGRLGLSFLLAFVLLLLVSLVVLAAYMRIEGDPLDIEFNEYGQKGVWYNGVSQYFATYSNNSVLHLNGTSMNYESVAQCTGPQFISVSHTLVNSYTLQTVFDAGSYARITQTVEYNNGDKYYKITWRIVNTTTQTITDTRFMHGGDTYFGGDDAATGHWSSALNMVYLTNPDPNIDGIMGLFGDATSPPAHYYEGPYTINYSEMCDGRLPDTVDGTYHDAGYSLEWDRASLAPGEEWVIVAYEKWTVAGMVQVIAPAGKSGGPNDVFDYSFTILNMQPITDAFNLAASSSQGWGVSILGSNPITITAGATELVTVTVSPSGASGLDTLVLTATSTTTPTITNSDSLVTTVSETPRYIYLPLVIRNN